jgi:hypothetical protein
VPFDLETTESYLFTFMHNGRSFAVAVPGRTEGEARHRFNMMSAMEKRERIVATLASEDRDVIADLFDWLGGLLQRRASRPGA